MDQRQAAAESARRRVKRAGGLLREAARDLAAATEGQTALGVVTVHDSDTAARVSELVSLGVARHGAVEVIVVARPTPRGAQPHHGPTGAEEPNGTHEA